MTAVEAPEHAFDVDTRVERVAPRRYRATVTDRWNALGGMPNGGYLLATCVRALRHDMPLDDPLVVAGFFVQRAAPGPAQIETEIARVGRRVATGQARLLQDGREILRAVATFTDLTRAGGRTLLFNERPDLPPPESCVDPLPAGGVAGISISERVEYRMPTMPGWLQGAPSGRPQLEFWMRFKDGREANPLSLVLLVDAAPPAVVELGEGSATIELTVHVRGRPKPGWLACRVTTRHVIAGFHEEDVEIWDSEGALVAQSRQLALLPGSTFDA